MKFKDLRSISTLLKEYGMTPGPATSVGQQNTGSITNKRTQSPSLKVSQSPTTQKQKSQAPKLNVAKAGELKKDFQFPDDKGNVLKVVSPAGEKTSIPNDNEDLVVAMNSKNEPVVFDKDADIAFPEMEEGKLGSFVKKARNKSLGKLKKTGGLRKLGRRGLKENPSELFEINFNNRDVIQNSLDARINCGFEAETVWPNVDHASDDPDNLSFSELVDTYDDARYNEEYIWESYSDWIREKAYDDYLPDIITAWVDDNLDDYDLRMEFVNDNVDDQEVEDHKDEFKAENPDEYKSRIEDGWDMDNWASELIDLNYEDDFKEWLNDIGQEDDDLQQQAMDEAESEWDIDYWCNDLYGSPAGAFREIADVYFDSEQRDVDGIAEVLHEWMRENSKFTNFPETGAYGDTEGGDIWAVESDGSIQGNGAHGEIISPVYSSPRQMLEEMKSLFEFMQDEGVITNSSTGLHITMSWAGDKDIKTNKIKAIVLSGVDHVVSMFGRKGNSYTKLRMPDLKRAMEKLKDGSESQKSIEQIEDILSNAINTDRTMAINFKGAKDPVNKNSLIEFRAAGGRDYHEKISDVVKTVVRYSATMVGSHTEEYNRDYVRALIKLINTMDEMSVDDIERTKQGTSNDNHPLVLLFQNMLGKHDFLDGMREIYVALNHLDEYNKLSQPDAEKKWKSNWNKYKKHSGKGLEDYDKNESIGVVKEAPNSGVEDAGSIPAMIRPSLKSPTEEAKDELRQAQKYFKIAMGRLSHDVAVNLNRSYINAKSISVFRKAIKEFQLTEDELANAIVAPTILQQVNFTNPDAREDNKLKYKLLSKGIHRLLKREKLVKDRYFLTPQMADKLIDGLWNYLHSGKATENGTKKILNLLALARQGEDQEESQDFVNAVYDRIRDKREYSEFFYELENGRNVRGAGLLEPNSVFNKEPLDKLLGFLKKFPEYSYPVSPKHSVNIYSDDDYTENFLKQLSIKVRRRLNHIRTLKDDNLALYFDIVEKLGKLISKTYNDLSAIDVKLGDEFPNLVGTDLENENDGKNFLGLYFGNGYMQDRMQKMLDKFATRNYATDEDGNDVVAEFNRFYDSIRDLLNSYSRSKKDNPKLYAFSPIPELIKSRMRTIKKFLKGIDKISVEDMGFNNTDNIIKAKADISKQEKEWKKKHGPKFVYEIDDFDFGGDVWINTDLVNDIIGGTEKSILKILRDYFDFDRSKYVAQYGLVRRIPNSHFFIAQEAQAIYDNPEVNLTWRKPVARKILEEFNRLYKTSFKSLEDENLTLQWNEGEIIKTLKKLNVGFTKDLGDGREGMKGLGDKPILPREEINGPYGEPFERSSASAWRANNLELAKKAEAEAEKLKKNMLSGKDEGIIVAAGVEGMGQSSSNEIANNTNWLVLSNHLDIKSGVDQQGANLLKKVYNMYDSNHNWRPDEDPDACCMPRYIAAVKAAKEYIEKNYIESGGNYFRKNIDGSIGDDVSAVHRTSQDSLGEIDSITLGDNDYQLARGKYDMFDVMMQSGIQDYIVSADTNRLVKFLKGDFSEKYKQAVIKALIQNKEGGGEPADMQQALALGRNNMESVFAKFNKLTLEEQLLLVEQSELLEKWSKKQKKSVDCSNPKGFSQKAHCAGRKARQAGKQTKSKSVSEGAVPDNSVVRIVNKLLAEPMPAGDLRKQMDAYFAIPDPKMLTDFRQRRAEGGNDACLRPVLRHYVKAQLNPSLQKSINLNESKIILNEISQEGLAQYKNMIQIIQDLKNSLPQKFKDNPKSFTSNKLQIQYKIAELKAKEKELKDLEHKIFSDYEKDIKTATQKGQEQSKSEIRKYHSTVDQLLNKLSDKISGGFSYITFSDDGIEQATEDDNGRPLTARDKKKQESEVKSVEQIKQALIGYFKDPELLSDNPDFTRDEILEFLTAAANGKILSMEDIMAVGTDPNQPEIAGLPDVVQKAAEKHGNNKYVDMYNRLVDDGLMFQTVANTTSGNVGPGELALLLLAAPAEKGARGDLSVGGKEVEIKSGSYSVGDSKTTAGGKFNSDFVLKGHNAGETLNKMLGTFFKEKLGKDFKKEFQSFMAKQEKPNKIRNYTLTPKRMNLPAISEQSFEYIYNPFFLEQNVTRDQFRTLARIFSQATFSGGARLKGGHFSKVLQTLANLHNDNKWYSKQIESIGTTKGINSLQLKRLIMALQYQSYYLNKGHDQILYINKTNQKITNVTNAKDLIDKFDRGIIVTAKDINLTDTQQTAAHSITAGL